jgi:hypothetical protein
LLTTPLIPPLKGGSNSVDGIWIAQYLQQSAEIIKRLERFHLKSLGAILALQERLAAGICCR